MGLGICGGPFKVMGCISLLTMALKLPEQFRWVHRPAEAGHKDLQMGSQENWWAGRQEHQDGGGGVWAGNGTPWVHAWLRWKQKGVGVGEKQKG